MQRINKTEAHINQIHATTQRLDSIDNLLKIECDKINRDLNEKLSNFKLESKQIQRGNEDNLKEHKNRLSTHTE